MYALDFQHKVSNHQKVALGKRVVVVGGGSAGLDAARVAMKVGAKDVRLLCLESRDLDCKDRMLATNYEIEQAEKEGLEIHPGLGVSKIVVEGGKVVGLETPCCTSVRNEYGKFEPQYSKKAVERFPADSVLIAIGLKPNAEFFPELEKSKTGNIKVKSISMETSMPGVFAGGDVMNGPTDVIVAIDSGKEAAISIDRFISGKDLKEGRQVKVRPYPRVPRDETKKRDLEFKNEIEAFTEAGRCFNCGECGEALQKGLQTPCVSACPAHSIYFRNLWDATPKTGTYTVGWEGEINKFE
jgi:heterodisulfide reductase subunit A-like polyferredoxin